MISSIYADKIYHMGWFFIYDRQLSQVLESIGKGVNGCIKTRKYGAGHQ